MAEACKHDRFVAAARTIDGHNIIVEECQTCRFVTIRGSGQWVPPDQPGLGARMEHLLEVTLERRRQWEEAFNSDITDSRWEQIS
jgi:hypothetical protein